MKLLGVAKRDNSLYSEWTLTFRVGWNSICKAVMLIYQYTKDPELFAGGVEGESRITVKKAEEILSIEESGSLTVRGLSEILEVPVMITFFNQTDLVRVTVISATEEFKEADYKQFNLSMCQFMDSAELAMYR